MQNDRTSGLTALLDEYNGGAAGAFTRLVDSVYPEVKRIAAARLARAFPMPAGALTLQPTAIAHDAILRLLQQRQKINDRKHFFAIATLLIRHIIHDYRKHRNAQKRGGGNRGVSLSHIDAAGPEPSGDDGSSHVYEALERLHDAHPRKAEVVTLHVICGHPLPKVADMIGVGLATAERDWLFAKKWLQRELGKKPA